VVLEKKFGATPDHQWTVTIARRSETSRIHISRTPAGPDRRRFQNQRRRGDGTTTPPPSWPMAMVKAGLRNVAAGANAITLKKAFGQGSDFLVKRIE